MKTAKLLASCVIVPTNSHVEKIRDDAYWRGQFN